MSVQSNPCHLPSPSLYKCSASFKPGSKLSFTLAPVSFSVPRLHSMKFGRYIIENQIPEWRKAYIDYKGLKKRIASISERQQNAQEENGFHANGPPSPIAISTELGHGVDERSLLTASPTKESADPIPVTPTTPQVVVPNILRKMTRKATHFAHRRPTLLHPFAAARSLTDTKAQLNPDEADFVNALDFEVDKVDTFYLKKLEDMSKRQSELSAQIRELSFHKAILEKNKKATPSWRDVFTGSKSTPPASDSELSSLASKERCQYLDREDYENAQKRLRKAVTEHYRALELLQNYRVLNLTGFRKILKKFEKKTKIPLADVYTAEKVEQAPFATDKTVETMMKELESVYVAHFAGGNRKQAIKRLKGGATRQTFHLSTLLSGVMIGFSVPAYASGLHRSFQADTRQNIPAWDALLLIYAICFIPVFLALLMSFNLVAWAHARVNYVFIFDIKSRKRLDYRQYLELPAFLFFTLSWAFFLSFVPHPHEMSGMDPKWWPIVWLSITAAVLVNPFPVFHRFARGWLFRRFGKLMLPGIGVVKFSDFWLGDQMTSLGFVFGSLPLFVCTYTTGFQPDWADKCGNKTNIWLGAFVLAALPLLVRLVQSMRRFADSGLHTHLLNAGKYGLGVVSQLCYYLWRHHGGRGTLFFLWITFNTIYAISAGSWDVWFDMSLLRRRAKHPWLRDELMYSEAVWSYWFAMVYNSLTRFAFVIYIPAVGPNDYLRSFIVSVIEITRRIMWNFFRLENEHIGNVDQYRATREVPLPYALENVEAHRRAETEDDDDASVLETVGVTTGVSAR